jgi:glycosyltransferase involved in cell wall biosynthesis
MMRILIATSQRGIVGGVETYLQGLIPALLQRGHQIAMLYDHEGEARGATVDPPEAGLPIWRSEELRKHPVLWEELTAWHPDVVYSHGIDSDGVEKRLQQSFRTVRFMHGYWGTCTTGRKCHVFPGIQACERTFGPMCLLMHYPRRCGGVNPRLAWKMFQNERIHNSLLKSYQAVLVASAHMRAEFSRHGVSPEMLHVVHLPLPEPPGPVALRPKTPGGRLLFVGRLTDVKGVDYLIRAITGAEAKLGRKLTLTVAGDGAEQGKLQELARREQAAVEFCGWVDSSRKMELMRQADLLVAPSLWPEPFGLVGIEAGCVGLPAAGFAAGGIPEWLIPGETGELAPADPPTVPGLADAMVRALANPDHYQKLCRGALEMSRRFTPARHVAELEAILYANAEASNSQTGAERISSHHAHEYHAHE